MNTSFIEYPKNIPGRVFELVNALGPLLCPNRDVEQIKSLPPMSDVAPPGRAFDHIWEHSNQGVDIRTNAIHAGWEDGRWWAVVRRVGTKRQLWAKLVDEYRSRELSRVQMFSIGDFWMCTGHCLTSDDVQWRVEIHSHENTSVTSKQCHRRNLGKQRRHLAELKTFIAHNSDPDLDLWILSRLRSRPDILELVFD